MRRHKVVLEIELGSPPGWSDDQLVARVVEHLSDQCDWVIKPVQATPGTVISDFSGEFAVEGGEPRSGVVFLMSATGKSSCSLCGDLITAGSRTVKMVINSGTMPFFHIDCLRKLVGLL